MDRTFKPLASFTRPKDYQLTETHHNLTAIELVYMLGLKEEINLSIEFIRSSFVSSLITTRLIIFGFD